MLTENIEKKAQWLQMLRRFLFFGFGPDPGFPRKKIRILNIERKKEEIETVRYSSQFPPFITFGSETSNAQNITSAENHTANCQYQNFPHDYQYYVTYLNNCYQVCIVQFHKSFNNSFLKIEKFSKKNLLLMHTVEELRFLVNQGTLMLQIFLICGVALGRRKV